MPITVRYSLRVKTLWMIGLTLAILIALLYGLFQHTFLQELAKLERREVTRHVERVQEALLAEQASLNSKVRDWSNWDQSYRFLAGKEPRFLQENMTPQALKDIRVNTILFMKLDGRPVAAIGRDAEGRPDASLSQEIVAFFRAHLSLLNPEGCPTGLLNLPGGPILLAMNPVLNSKAEGPARGFLVFAIRMDDVMTKRIAHTTHLQVRFEPLDDVASSTSIDTTRESKKDAEQASRSPSSTTAPSIGSHPVDVRAVGKDLVEGSTLLDDVTGRPCRHLFVGTERDIYRGGGASLKYLMGSILLLGLIFGALTLGLLEFAVLSRLARLNTDIELFEQPGGVTHRVREEGRDEITRVAHTVNRSMDRIEELFTEIQRLAITDPLTGLFNRRHVMEKTEIEVSRSKRHGHSLSALMVDVDYFKRINDTYGHAIGDQILRVISERLRTSLRREDILGRYGGEEFVVFMPDTDLTSAIFVAERWRSELASTPIRTEAGDIPVTASIGVSVFRPEDSVDQMLHRADQALYGAKAKGRNCVVAESQEARLEA